MCECRSNYVLRCLIARGFPPRLFFVLPGFMVVSEVGADDVLAAS